MKLRKALVLLFFVLASNLFALSVEAKTKLTRSEVMSKFVGTPWHGPSGVFLFRMDGTYTYREFKSGKQGTWSYKLLPNGGIEGASTTYTFFRRNNGTYFYHHSTSNRNFKATPNQTAPFN